MTATTAPCKCSNATHTHGAAPCKQQVSHTEYAVCWPCWITDKKRRARDRRVAQKGT